MPVSGGGTSAGAGRVAAGRADGAAGPVIGAFDEVSTGVLASSCGVDEPPMRHTITAAVIAHAPAITSQRLRFIALD
jgi:hypothetical protein